MICFVFWAYELVLIGKSLVEKPHLPKRITYIYTKTCMKISEQLYFLQANTRNK